MPATLLPSCFLGSLQFPHPVSSLFGANNTSNSLAAMYTFSLELCAESAWKGQQLPNVWSMFHLVDVICFVFIVTLIQNAFQTLQQDHHSADAFHTDRGIWCLCFVAQKQMCQGLGSVKMLVPCQAMGTYRFAMDLTAATLRSGCSKPEPQKVTAPHILLRIGHNS